MIRINLGKRKRGPGSIGIKDLKNMSAKDFLGLLQSANSGKEGEQGSLLKSPLFKMVIAGFACWYLQGIFEDLRTSKLGEMDQRIQKIQAEHAAVSDKLAKLKGFEPVKKQLEDDESAVRVKINVLSELLQNRDIPAKMMMEIARSIPSEVWLTRIRVDEDDVTLSGGTPSHTFVSDFIRALSNTSYFGEIALSGIQESEAKENQFQSFDLNAMRRRTN